MVEWERVDTGGNARLPVIMLQLYFGSGSREVQLVDQCDQARWDTLKRRAVRFLEVDNSANCAALLQAHPFELWTGTNSFNDDFEVLYLRTDFDTYLSLKQQHQSSQFLFWRIAQALQELNNPIRFIVADAVEGDVEPVSTPTLATTSAVVQRALQDCEALMRTSGAASGLDRVHTALHGYLIEVCREANIQHSADASITALFGQIRDQHPRFQGDVSDTSARLVVKGLGTIIDALNQMRNRHSMAHPNEELLNEPEAALAINAIRSVLHYLEAKLQ